MYLYWYSTDYCSLYLLRIYAIYRAKFSLGGVLLAPVLPFELLKYTIYSHSNLDYSTAKGGYVQYNSLSINMEQYKLRTVFHYFNFRYYITVQTRFWQKRFIPKKTIMSYNKYR